MGEVYINSLIKMIDIITLNIQVDTIIKNNCEKYIDYWSGGNDDYKDWCTPVECNKVVQWLQRRNSSQAGSLCWESRGRLLEHCNNYDKFIKQINDLQKELIKRINGHEGWLKNNSQKHISRLRDDVWDSIKKDRRAQLYFNQDNNNEAIPTMNLTPENNNSYKIFSFMCDIVNNKGIDALRDAEFMTRGCVGPFTGAVPSYLLDRGQQTEEEGAGAPKPKCKKRRQTKKPLEDLEFTMCNEEPVICANETIFTLEQIKKEREEVNYAFSLLEDRHRKFVQDLYPALVNTGYEFDDADVISMLQNESYDTSFITSPGGNEIKENIKKWKNGEKVEDNRWKEFIFPGYGQKIEPCEYDDEAEAEQPIIASFLSGLDALQSTASSSGSDSDFPEINLGGGKRRKRKRKQTPKKKEKEIKEKKQTKKKTNAEEEKEENKKTVLI